MLRLSVCTARSYRAHIAVGRRQDLQSYDHKLYRAFATSTPKYKKSKKTPGKQQDSDPTLEKPKIRWYQQLLPWSTERTQSHSDLGFAPAEYNDEAKWLEDEIAKNDAELREMEGGRGKTLVEPLLATLPEEDAQKVRKAIMIEDRAEERKEKEAALIQRQLEDEVLPKIREELEIRWQLPPEQEMYLQHLNTDVLKASAEPTNQSLRRKLWLSYARCKAFLPPFLHLIPSKTWDVLWASQQIATADENKWGAHLITLSEDMVEAGKDMTIYQRILFVEALRSQNQRKRAMTEWQKLGYLIEDDERASAEHELLGVRLFASQGDPGKAEKIAMNFLDQGKDRESRILIPILHAWAQRGDDTGIEHAWALYLRYRTMVGSEITMDDYDSISMAFLDIGRTDIALAVFKDMMLTGRRKDFTSVELYRKSTGIMGKLQASAITAEEINRLSLTGLIILPHQYQNKFFYGSWLKKLIGMGAIDAAAQVTELQVERGIKPDPQHLNGLIGAWLRREYKDDREKAESMAWTMIQERLKFVERRRKGSDTRDPITTKHTQVSSSHQLQRTATPANIETLALLLQYYVRRREKDSLNKVQEALELGELKPNVYYINHLLYYDLRRGEHQAAWIKYKDMFGRTIKPDLETFAALWDCEKNHLESLTLHYQDQFPNPRQIMSEMMDWIANINISSRQWEGIREEFSQEFYEQILRCFGLASDAEGLLVALYALHDKFGCYPTMKTMRMVNIAVSRMKAGEMGENLHPGRKRLGRPARKDKKNNISQIMGIVVALRERVLQNAGVDDATFFDDDVQEKERLYILAEFIRTVLRRTSEDEGAVEGNIEKVAWQMGVGGIPMKDPLPSYGEKKKGKYRLVDKSS